MFENTKAFSGFAVDDIEAARQFYGETLGLKVSEAHGMLTLHIAGDRPTIVYPRPGHEPATYTILNFPVDDIDAAVDALAERGVAVRALRRHGAGREGRHAGRRPVHRLVHRPGRQRPLGAPGAVTTPGVTVDDVRAFVAPLPRSYEVLVRDRVKFRVGQIVYVAFSRDETLMGFAFSKEEREALVASEPEKFLMPTGGDLRFNWVIVRLAAIDIEEMRELVFDAWRWVVPKKLAAAYDERFFAGEL